MQLGVLASLVVIGLICIVLLDSYTAKARAGIIAPNSCPDSARFGALVKRHYATPAGSANTVAASEKLAKLRPNDPVVQTLLGNAYADAGRLQEAITSYRAAISLDAHNFEAHVGLGRVYFERRRHQEAIDAYERALRFRPRSADVHLALGIALSHAGRYDEAMRAFSQARELDPQVTETQVLTGRAYLRAGLYAQAIQSFQDAVCSDQENAQAHYNLGRAYLRVGDTGLALKQHQVLESLNSQLADQLLALIQN